MVVVLGAAAGAVAHAPNLRATLSPRRCHLHQSPVLSTSESRIAERKVALWAYAQGQSRSNNLPTFAALSPEPFLGAARGTKLPDTWSNLHGYAESMRFEWDPTKAESNFAKHGFHSRKPLRLSGIASPSPLPIRPF